MNTYNISFSPKEVPASQSAIFHVTFPKDNYKADNEKYKDVLQ